MALRHATAVALLVIVAACSSSDDGEQAATTTSSSTSTTSPSTTTTSPTEVPIGDCPSRPEGSSPAAFDDAAGTYAVQELAITDEGDLRFDVVQWLSGEDADEAYEAETGDSSGVPNDYYILNESPTLRDAPLAAEPQIYVLDVDATAALRPATVDELAAHLDASLQPTWWLTFEDGAVTEVCQQYRP